MLENKNEIQLPPEKEARKLTKKDLWRIYWYGMSIESGCNYKNQEAPGFTQALIPCIEKVYDNDEDKREAYRRHTEFFNTESKTASLAVGISAAMEERNALYGDINPDSINAMKVSLMGPLAGIGDSLIHGTARPIFAGIACSIAMASQYTSLAGTLLFVLAMSIICFGVRYIGIFKGYEKGVEFVANMQSGGYLTMLTTLAGIAAFVVCGGFIPSLISINLAIEYAAGDSVINLQEMLNGLVPSLLPLLFTMLMYWLMTKKKVPIVPLMFGTLIFGIIAVYLGILG